MPGSKDFRLEVQCVIYPNFSRKIETVFQMAGIYRYSKFQTVQTKSALNACTHCHLEQNCETELYWVITLKVFSYDFPSTVRFQLSAVYIVRVRSLIPADAARCHLAFKNRFQINENSRQMKEEVVVLPLSCLSPPSAECLERNLLP